MTEIGEWGKQLPGELQDKWPKDSSGEFEEPVFLKHCSSTDLEDELLSNMLGAYGIPSVKSYPNDGRLGRVILGISGTGSDIFVPASMLEDAIELCKGAPEENEDI